MTELVRPWRGMSVEDRLSERRTRLLDACLNVVGGEGVAGTTVDRVCADAKLTKRYFYESFADLDALLLAAADDLFADGLGRMQAVVADNPGQDNSHAVVVILVDFLSEDPRRSRLYAESPGHTALRARREQAVATFTAFVAGEVLPAPSTPVSTQARLLAVRLLVAGTTDLVTSWLAGDIEADRTSVIEAIERLGSSA